MRARLLAATAVAGLGLSGPVLAQTAPDATAPSDIRTEVVVTAQKREQTLTQVPVAITAFTAAKRDQIGVDSIDDFANFTPGFVYNPQTDRVSLRGISRVSNQLGLDSSVSTYEDGVFETFIVNAGESSLFLDRVEILRGPQGTLYGRNSNGGAVNIVSRRPTKTPYAEVRFSYNNFNEHIEEGAVAGPIADGVQARLAASKTDQPTGYFKNLAPGGHSEGQVRDEWYVELQLQGQWGSRLDWWLKGFDRGWDDLSGGPGGRFTNQVIVGPDGRTPVPANRAFYSLGVTAGGALNIGETGDSLVPALGQYTLPGTANIVSANPTLTNPGNRDIRTIYELTSQTVKLHNDKGLLAELTFHFPGFDLKYVGGALGYAYETHEEYGENYQLGTGVVSYTSPPLGGATIYPESLLYYGEYHWLTSNEFNLISNTDGPLQWVAGFYNHNEGYTQPEQVVLPGQGQLAQPYSLAALLGAGALSPAPANPTRAVVYYNFRGGAESFATFGQVDYKVVPDLKATVGLRYTYDAKYGVDSTRFLAFGPQLGAPVPLGFDFTAVAIPLGGVAQPGASAARLNPATGFAYRHLGANWGGLTGTAGLQWDPDRSTNLYAKYSRGYKSGGFNAGQGLSPFPRTKPEYVNDFQVGFKKNIGRQITFAIDGFYDQYLNAQEPISISTGTTLTGSITNLNEARIYGVELETSWSPTRALNILVNYGYLNTRIQKADCLVDAGGDPTATGPGATPGACPTLPSGSRGQTIVGNPLPNTPKNKVAFNANYTFFLPFGNLTFSGNYVWRDKQYGTLFARSFDEAPAWDQVDLRAQLVSVDKHWTLIAYGKNVTDTVGYPYGATAVRQYNGTYVKNFTINEPPIGGVEVQYKF